IVDRGQEFSARNSGPAPGKPLGCTAREPVGYTASQSTAKPLAQEVIPLFRKLRERVGHPHRVKSLADGGRTTGTVAAQRAGPRSTRYHHGPIGLPAWIFLARKPPPDASSSKLPGCLP